MFSLPLLIGFWTAPTPRQDTPLEARLLTPQPERYGRIEIGLTPDRVPANPYDPGEADLQAVFTLPTGRKMTVPGFWYQDYRRSLKDPKAEGDRRVEILEARGSPEWRVRFSSGEIGLHRCVLTLKDRSGTRHSRELVFEVRDSEHPGFVRISPRNKTYLEEERGRPFFPLGHNLCMSPEREGTYFYDRILPKLAANGGNYVRLWQEYYVQGDLKRPAGPGHGSNTGFPLETVQTGLGRYDLECAWKLDYVAELCEKLGIGWQLCFEMVVWWNRQMPHRWLRNPYNAANGGPCAEPAHYLTDPRCRELARRRVRYSVARWGWTPRLVAWELWNEVDNLDGFTSEANVAWHRDVGGYLKSIDPWRHLVTTSWRDPAMFALPEIDLVQAHSYWAPAYDAATYTLQDTDHLMRPFGKPFFFGEQGMSEGFDLDPEGKVFHDCLWASSLSGAAGAGMHWWWNNYIEKHDLYRHYSGLSKFLQGVDWPAHSWKPLRPTRPHLPVYLNVIGLAAEDRALVWIHDPLAFRIEGGRSLRGPRQTAASVNVAGPQAGHYRVEWFHTTTGESIGRDSTEVKPLRHFGYGLELKPPEFWGDVAAKVLLRGKEWAGR